MDIKYKERKNANEKIVVENNLNEITAKLIEKNIVKSIVKMSVDDNMNSYLQFTDLVIETTFHDLENMGFKNKIETDCIEKFIISRIKPYFEYR